VSPRDCETPAGYERGWGYVTQGALLRIDPGLWSVTASRYFPFAFITPCSIFDIQSALLTTPNAEPA